MADSEGLLSRKGFDGLEEDPPINLTPTNLEEIRAKGGKAPPPASGAPGPEPDIAGERPEVSGLADRVARLENLIGEGLSNIADTQELLTQIQELTSKVESLMTSMQGTVGYGARQTFVCRKCQQQGNVAAKLNCTSCGEENWWGWWPPQQG